MVDDVLLFLSYLVKAPALPRRPSWLPAPISIMAHAASSALHAASPASGRTRSRSHSSGGSSFGRISGHQSHGTPTSARSFGSAGMFGPHNSRASSSSASGATHDSYRSIGGSRFRRHSRGADATTPSSQRSRCASLGLEVLKEANTVGAGKHVAVDADETLECSLGEPARKDALRHK